MDDSLLLFDVSVDRAVGFHLSISSRAMERLIVAKFVNVPEPALGHVILVAILRSFLHGLLGLLLRAHEQDLAAFERCPPENRRQLPTA